MPHGQPVINSPIPGPQILNRGLKFLWAHKFSIAQLPDRVEPDSNEHLNIIEALENDDAKAACKAVRTHIKSLTKSALQLVSIDA